MSFVHGKNATVLFGTFNLSTFFNDTTTSKTQEVAETTTYQVNGGAKTYVVGHNDGTISLSGLFDADVGAVDPVISTALTSDTATPALTCPQILAIGTRCTIANVNDTTYEVTSPVADVVSVSAEFQATGGLDSAVALHALTAETVSTNSTAADNGAATTNGGVAQLNVIANGRTASSTIKVQHSTDNVTFVDLATFTAVAASTTVAERVAVAGTVNRYLRASSTLGGSTNSMSYSVAFARR
jgi:hypothetical protein